jgi:hypothetical protein
LEYGEPKSIRECDAVGIAVFCAWEVYIEVYIVLRGGEPLIEAGPSFCQSVSI